MFSKARRPLDGDNPPRSSLDASRGVPSIVSPDLVVSGNLKSQGDVQVDGKVLGDVEAASLTVGENGVIEGRVTARSLHVCGGITGEVNGGTVTLAASARVQGDIVHESLAIEAGAYVDGHCRRKSAREGDGQARLRTGSAPAAPGAAKLMEASEANPADGPAAAANGSASKRSDTRGA